MKTYYGIAFVSLVSLLCSLLAMNLVKRGGKYLTILIGWPAWMAGLFWGTDLLFKYDEPYFRSLNNDTIGSPVLMIPFATSFFVVAYLGERLTKNVKPRSRR